MESEASFSDFLVYLDSVKDLYPGGVPQNLIDREFAGLQETKTVEPEAGLLAASGEGTSGIMFFAFVGDEIRESGTPFTGAEGELLRTVLVKAMKLDPEVVLVCGSSRKAVLDNPWQVGAEILELIKTSSPEFVLVCAGKSGEGFFPNLEAANRVISYGDSKVFLTQDLLNVAKGGESKRLFWEDLKRVLKGRE